MDPLVKIHDSTNNVTFDPCPMETSFIASIQPKLTFILKGKKY